MPYLVDTGILVDVSRNNPAAIACIDRLSDDWSLSAITALEFIAGAKNQREVALIGRLIEVYSCIPVNDAIGKPAYVLLKTYPNPTDFARSIRSPLTPSSPPFDTIAIGVPRCPNRTISPAAT